MLGAQIGEITLRNRYVIYGSPSGYMVVAVDRHGDRHEQSFESESVSLVADFLDGERVTVDQALESIEPLIDQGILELPFTYGHKLRFYLQSILLILVATGRAELCRGGRAFAYAISNQ